MGQIFRKNGHFKNRSSGAPVLRGPFAYQTGLRTYSKKGFIFHQIFRKQPSIGQAQTGRSWKRYAMPAKDCKTIVF